MAAYATVSEVQAHIPTQLLEIAPQTQPSLATVEAWLEAESRWMDAALRWRYSVPITNATDSLVLAMICALLVAARCWSVIGGHSAELPGSAKDLRSEAYTLLGWDTRAGHSMLVLPNSAESDSGEAAVGQPLGTFTDPDADGSDDRYFKIRMDW